MENIIIIAYCGRSETERNEKNLRKLRKQEVKYRQTLKGRP